jgi:hypothetical protein
MTGKIQGTEGKLVAPYLGDNLAILLYNIQGLNLHKHAYGHENAQNASGIESSFGVVLEIWALPAACSMAS